MLVGEEREESLLGSLLRLKGRYPHTVASILFPLELLIQIVSTMAPKTLKCLETELVTIAIAFAHGSLA